MSGAVRGSTNSAQSHLDFLDGLRACAALYVVFHHAALNLPEGSIAGPLNVALRKALGQGHYAVDVFIVLSGYCLMLPVLQLPPSQPDLHSQHIGQTSQKHPFQH